MQTDFTSIDIVQSSFPSQRNKQPIIFLLGMPELHPSLA